MKPSYTCAKCGAAVFIDKNMVITRECEEHDEYGVILEMGRVELVGASKLSNE